MDNQYTLVVVTAKRARQVVDYYTRLGAGQGEARPIAPLLASPHGLKPLSIAMREVEEAKIGYERPPGTEESVK